MKNSVEEISEENAVDAFRRGLSRRELKEELGRQKPNTVSQLMDIANRWADGEDSVKNERLRLPENDNNDSRYSHDVGRGSGRNNDRRKKRKHRGYEEADHAELVAAQFAGKQDGGYRKREWQPRKSRGDELPFRTPAQELSDGCPGIFTRMNMVTCSQRTRYRSGTNS